MTAPARVPGTPYSITDRTVVWVRGHHTQLPTGVRCGVPGTPEDYTAFERILGEGLVSYDVRLFCFQLMPNHWHLVLRPNADGELSRFMRWITATHTMRFRAHYHTSGEGHVYQGRFKSFPIQDDGHFLTVCRYVERNAVRARLVKQAEDWRWGSLWRWMQPTDPDPVLLSPWPIPRSPNWVDRVRGTPYSIIDRGVKARQAEVRNVTLNY